MATPFEIAYEDDHLLVVDKSPGIVVHPARGHREGTLSQLLAGVAAGGDPERAGIVHRLDRDTSGLLVVARSEEALEGLRKEVLRGIALTHPGIVRVYSFERDTTGAAIVMEYVEGQTLSDLKARQPNRCFDPERLRPWLEQLCAVLVISLCALRC